MDVPIAETAGIIGCLLVAAFFSLSEAVLTTIGPARAEKALGEGQRQFKELAHHPERVHYALVLGKFGALLAAATLVGGALDRAGVMSWGIPLFVVLAILVVEIAPRSMAMYRARALAGPLLRVLSPWLFVLRPVTTAFEKLAHLVRPRSDQPEPAPNTVSEEDLALMIDVGVRQGTLTDFKERILHSVFEFGDTIVREVMVPRTDVVAASTDISYDELLKLVVEEGHSRIPVYRGSIDEIVGVFYAKDLLEHLGRLDARNFAIEKLVREAFFVPETRAINELFTDMQRQRVHMAVVVNEFGGTAGIVTLEDIFEEFFGEIQDEYDDEEAPIVALGEDRYLVDARISVDEVEELFDVEFPEDDNYDTLGGFITTELGRVPDPGQEFTKLGLRFRVQQATPKRVERVEILREDESAETDDADGEAAELSAESGRR